MTLPDSSSGARALGVPFKEAVNQAIRSGLREAARPRRGAAPKTIPHSFGFRPGVDLDKLNQLADELESETFVATSQRPRDPARRQRTEARGVTKASLRRLLEALEPNLNQLCSEWRKVHGDL